MFKSLFIAVAVATCALTTADDTQQKRDDGSVLKTAVEAGTWAYHTAGELHQKKEVIRREITRPVVKLANHEAKRVEHWLGRRLGFRH